MTKQKKFKKVVEWKERESIISSDIALPLFFLCGVVVGAAIFSCSKLIEMVATSFIGILIVVMVILSLPKREVYWEEIQNDK